MAVSCVRECNVVDRGIAQQQKRVQFGPGQTLAQRDYQSPNRKDRRSQKEEGLGLVDPRIFFGMRRSSPVVNEVGESQKSEMARMFADELHGLLQFGVSVGDLSHRLVLAKLRNVLRGMQPDLPYSLRVGGITKM